MGTDRMLFDFTRPGDAERWRAVNDGVMGGVSTGAFAATSDGGALFSGVVSLKNYGGFASVRSAPQALDLCAYAGVALNVRGDGKRYKLRLRDDPAFDGVTYEAAFLTQRDVWEVVSVSFAALQPVFRGRLLSAPPLNLRTVWSFGLLISDKQAGLFALEVAWITAYPVEVSP